MNRITTSILLILALHGAVVLRAQGQEEPTAPGFQTAADSLSAQLQASLSELSAYREQVAEEKLPMSRELSRLESMVQELRREVQQRSRAVTDQVQAVTNLQSEIKALDTEQLFIENLLTDYGREFRSRLHITEEKRYAKEIEAYTLAEEDISLSREDQVARKTDLVDLSVTRMSEALGGTIFKASVVDTNGLVKMGDVLLLGGTAYFKSMDGQAVGIADVRTTSLEPTLQTFAEESDRDAVSELISSGSGMVPLDITMGSAFKMEALEESFIAHVKKGGPVMIPIFVMAGLALLVALYKWGTLSAVQKPSKKQLQGLYDAVERFDVDEARDRAQAMKGPIGKMFRAGAEHLHEPKELVEEVLYERVLSAKLKLQSMLPFIAICAASAPLLGLLGTVTGIINTFKIITEFGSGDVKSLSGGISEALITTKFGLIVAIPSLLLHAYLSRMAKGVLSLMESSAISFVNHMSTSPARTRALRADAQDLLPTPSEEPDLKDRVHAVLLDLLGPSYQEKLPKILKERGGDSVAGASHAAGFALSPDTMGVAVSRATAPTLPKTKEMGA